MGCQRPKGGHLNCLWSVPQDLHQYEVHLPVSRDCCGILTLPTVFGCYMSDLLDCGWNDSRWDVSGGWLLGFERSFGCLSFKCGFAWVRNLVGDREVILSSSLTLPQAEKHFGRFFVECFVSLSHCSQMFPQWKTCEAGGLGVATHPSQV